MVFITSLEFALRQSNIHFLGKFGEMALHL